tara:strand:- start:3385 stop:3588 length:204 start_codon:yes stop_codon:yes gene_type:complete
MKKYVNTNLAMQAITFEDGETVFMRRMQSIVTDREIKSMTSGIRVFDVPAEPVKKKTRTTEDKVEEK